VWDATGDRSPNKTGIYLVYTDETVQRDNDTDILMPHVDDDGATWSAPVRVKRPPAPCVCSLEPQRQTGAGRRRSRARRAPCRAYLVDVRIKCRFFVFVRLVCVTR